MNTKPQITLVEAFVKGAKWWEYHKTGATMWQSDQTLAAEEAAKRFATIKAEEVSLQSAIKGEHRIHGVTCVKVTHTRDGMLHGEDDDRPYDVDGAKYCGRCHLHITTEEIAFAETFGHFNTHGRYIPTESNSPMDRIASRMKSINFEAWDTVEDIVCEIADQLRNGWVPGLEKRCAEAKLHKIREAVALVDPDNDDRTLFRKFVESIERILEASAE